jgi:MbtH protein
MANPFDDPGGKFLTLINVEGQYSLWPAFAKPPAGWKVAHGEDSRQASLDFIELNWTDLRPKRLLAGNLSAEGVLGP